jgi:predicted enzyme related to lactoylglutathione lyase
VRTSVTISVLAAAAAIFCSAPMVAISSSVGHVTGIGGVVVVSKNPRALAAWYRNMLGISLEPWGGAMFRYNVPGHPPYTVWSSFSKGAKEFAHSRRDFMLNLSVDNLDALCTRLHAKGVPIYERQSTSYGKFASVVDPDGTKIELWEAPKR